MSETANRRLVLTLLLLLAAVLLWSVIDANRYYIWFAEAMPALAIVAILIITYKRFKFSSLFYVLLFVSFVWMLIGAHYTYERVPLFNWIRDEFGQNRNHFDRIGHYFQGIIPALAVKELAWRLNLIPHRNVRAIVALSFTLAVSGFYEIVEFLAYLAFGGEADDFLGHQGDEWDAQWDMIWAFCGGLTSILLLDKLHDKQIRKLNR
ncbi:hypothetical protein SY83_03245 [Paenibacillus swuensis]|uniref:DUF2238 domain-containing protein n=1 Tax=Paenibacillus swuensis TaxID=1178515 RepID=A0A172TF39_9BACL|nr:DUF2238 domain-containing protein [Paenibacillus swuensis]ANE45497.1 hypothetical protein SY83_03245 [Paenibacillus swuensis]